VLISWGPRRALRNAEDYSEIVRKAVDVITRRRTLNLVNG